MGIGGCDDDLGREYFHLVLVLEAQSQTLVGVEGEKLDRGIAEKRHRDPILSHSFQLLGEVLRVDDLHADATLPFLADGETCKVLAMPQHVAGKDFNM